MIFFPDLREILFEALQIRHGQPYPIVNFHNQPIIQIYNMQGKQDKDIPDNPFSNLNLLLFLKRTMLQTIHK